MVMLSVEEPVVILERSALKGIQTITIVALEYDGLCRLDLVFLKEYRDNC